MSMLNDKMTAWIGANWKTTLSGVSAALSYASAGVSYWADAPKWIVAVCCALGVLSHVISSIVAADGTVAPTNKPDAAKSGQAYIGLLMLVASAALAVLIILPFAGCAKVAGRIQSTDDAIAARIPGGPVALAQLRGALAERSGYVSTNGMTRETQWWDLDHNCAMTNNIELREWYIRRTPVIIRPSTPPAPEIQAAAIITGTNNPPSGAGGILDGPVTGTIGK